jgi:small subunit ribosomal protein S3
MGQKVHPKGLRIGPVYNWSSRWFFSDKANYKKALLEDVQIRDQLLKRFSFASITNVDIERAINKVTVIIHAVKPGMIIGRGGKGLEEVKKNITKFLTVPQKKKKKDIKIDLKIEPVKKSYLNAYYVAQTISDKLVRSFPHRAAVHNAMNKVMESGAKGVKVQLGGRIAGAEISRKEKYFQGNIPTSTVRENIDYALYPARTKSGYVGVKVWVCKKDTTYN